MPKKALVVLPNTTILPDYDADIVICADSGYEIALSSGLKVDLIIGDMDSIRPQLLDEARKNGVEVLEYPVDKDLSDGELAVLKAKELGAGELLVLGGRLGRVDHFLTSLLLPLLFIDGPEVKCMIDDEVCVLVKEGQTKEISGEYRLFSLIPLSSGCRISVTGAKWDLDYELLPMGTTRGIHNEALVPGTRMICHKGTVLLVMSNRD
ncbi:MAG: thiamine diphosphokinase [Thermoplasmatota archaeon]